MKFCLAAGEYAAKAAGISNQQTSSVLALLIEEECTVPFITRYRKEKTGGLDEDDIRNIHKNYEEYLEREKRRNYILDSIEKMEKLTPDLKKQILAADSLNKLEDLYAPYKSKKKSKGQLAEEAGLSSLADLILGGDKTPVELKSLEKEYLNKDFKILNFEDALEGAQAILIEKMAHNSQLKDGLRNSFWKLAKLASSKRKTAEESKDSHKFKDYYEYKEKIVDLKLAKAGHRYLAMRRGLSKKILRVEVEFPEDEALSTIHHNYKINGKKTEGILKTCSRKAYCNYILPSLDNEIKTELKKYADQSAIDVFKVNLKNLLLQPYLGAKAVLGLDPGVRSGVKLAVVDNTGKFLIDTVIYPHEPQKDIKGSVEVLNKMIKHFKIEHLAIGNGTYGRETLQLINDNIPAVREGKIKATLINEDGASIYSTSPQAKEEFPDKDAVVRGAISIARRFQDPLAELVKIDPKSLGVGQYQHDVQQTLLKKSLTGVVESCVNFVGVNVNTASAPLLAYISGIGPTLAKNIVKTREKRGGFQNRNQLHEISRFTPKVYQQCAGFLRIHNGENPLDSTFIHPEQYDNLEKWISANGLSLNDLLKKEEAIKALSNDNSFIEKVGEYTHQDIVKSLKAPSQDPRTEFKSFEFRADARDIKSLKINEWYPGQVTNITQFGAFIDIGIKENGLVHVSQMSDSFVSDPLSVFKLGQEVKVKIMDIDYDRGRISLTCKTKDSKAVTKKKKETKKESPKRKTPEKKTATPQKKENLKQNPFASLGNIKLK
ncbi:MAG: RNA-binding transcriptional accessory protein [Halobacteriovoraceae bacterium]|jgi:protein Tex|nr:RNA-binding transcriptional accessory protein [Halobacteriovoraceae bacterium]MBT5094152.1 RNA-binding transcriptional accessory protein [Halobacteriovoraceae bacterium]